MKNKTLDILYRIILLIAAVMEIYFMITGNAGASWLTPLLLFLVAIYAFIQKKNKENK